MYWGWNLAGSYPPLCICKQTSFLQTIVFGPIFLVLKFAVYFLFIFRQLKPVFLFHSFIKLWRIHFINFFPGSNNKSNGNEWNETVLASNHSKTSSRTTRRPRTTRPPNGKSPIDFPMIRCSWNSGTSTAEPEGASTWTWHPPGPGVTLARVSSSPSWTTEFKPTILISGTIKICQLPIENSYILFLLTFVTDPLLCFASILIYSKTFKETFQTKC